MGAGEWWQVDLGVPYHVTSLQLVNSSDADQQQVGNIFEVRASNHSDGSRYVVLGSQGSSALAFNGTWSFTPINANYYRYIRIVQTNNSNMNIAELRATGVVKERHKSLIRSGVKLLSDSMNSVLNIFTKDGSSYDVTGSKLP